MFGKKRAKQPYHTVAIDSKDSPLSLRVIKGVLVVVEDLASGVEKDGLTADQIQNDVEAKCKGAGIKIMSNEESLKEAGYPILAVIVDVKKFKGNGHFLYSINVDLHQNVHLERDPRITIIGATTWTSKSYGIGNDLNSLRLRVSSHMDKFIKAYSAANQELVAH